MPNKAEVARVIYSIHAKSHGEVLAHVITRTQFDRDVVADARTRNLFSWWAERMGVDPLIADLAARLDDVARRAELPTRVALHADKPAVQRVLSTDEHARLVTLDEEIARRVKATLTERAGHVLAFIGTELFSRPPRFLSWLCVDLMDLFEMEIEGHIWGIKRPVEVSLPPTITDVPPGQRPKLDAAHLRRYTQWFYRAQVQTPPRATHAALAEEWREAMKREGETAKAPKEGGRLTTRADTKAVRYGIREAKRLLELAIPPEQWLNVFGRASLFGGTDTLH